MAIQASGELLLGCVLAMLSKGDAYGYSLTQSARETLDVSESTLYPVMRRLQTEECLTVYDSPHNGRNRRYYRITPLGLARYEACAADWADFRRKIDSMLGGSSQ